LVKDLEDLTNVYLTDMSDGRFQLGFEVNSSDKLNVVITDNGTDIDIAALSTGERARVNIATLLAIRKLMQSLSSTKTNLLILDETVENLDSEGKEKLIEILVNEPDLNTFLISHGFSHPLLEKLHIVKTNNISRISSD
jgi:DNA repair exonuclease SbcCD ATPase subunit